MRTEEDIRRLLETLQLIGSLEKPEYRGSNKSACNALLWVLDEGEGGATPSKP